MRASGAGDAEGLGRASVSGTPLSSGNSHVSKLRQKAAPIIGALAEHWPVFSVDPWKRQPLARGIAEAILAAAPGTFAPDELRAALKFYTGSLDYLRSCREGVARVDLNGNATGTVTAAEAAYAARTIIERRRQRNKTKPVGGALPTVRRLSLADLKEAAAQRRKAVTL